VVISLNIDCEMWCFYLEVVTKCLIIFGQRDSRNSVLYYILSPFTTGIVESF
jgi:hypothetical protein